MGFTRYVIYHPQFGVLIDFDGAEPIWAAHVEGPIHKVYTLTSQTVGEEMAYLLSTAGPQEVACVRVPDGSGVIVPSDCASIGLPVAPRTTRSDRRGIYWSGLHY